MKYIEVVARLLTDLEKILGSQRMWLQLYPHKRKIRLTVYKPAEDNPRRTVSSVLFSIVLDPEVSVTEYEEFILSPIQDYAEIQA